MAGRNSVTNLLEFAATVGTFIPNPWIKGISLLTGVIISSLPTKRPKPMEESQSYGWEHTANKLAAAGSPMPVIYGKTRVKPVLKNRYIAMDGDRQWLYALYSFAGHGIDQRTLQENGQPLVAWVLAHDYAIGDEVVPTAVQLAAWPWWNGYTFVCVKAHRSAAVFTGKSPINNTDYVPLFFDSKHIWDKQAGAFWKIGHGTAEITDIEINGNPITSYDPAACYYETRPGTALQGQIEGFEVTYQNNYEGTPLKPLVREWASFSTYYVNDIVEWPAGFSSPSTLYICVAESTGNQPPNPAYWTLLGTGTVGPYKDGIGKGWPDACFTQATISTSGGTQLLVDINFPNGLFEIENGTTMKSHTVWIFIWQKKSTESWDKAWCTNLVDLFLTKKTQKAFHWTHRWDVTEGTYDIRVLYMPVYATIPSSQYYFEHTAELANVASLVYAPFTYPGEPLLGIKVLATEKLQGDIEVTGVCERSKVWVRDGTNNYPANPGWNKLDADNHAWAIYDLLVQGSSTHPSYNNADQKETLPSYGCGIPYSRVDYTSFKAWADFIDTLLPAAAAPHTPAGYHLNIVFDSFMSIWEAIIMIAFEGRGSVLPYGAQYYAIPDQASGAVALICEGNIVANSLTQAWGDRSKRANSMEVTYKDALRGYDDVTFIVRTEEWATDASLTDAARQTLYGTTLYDQAYRIAKYFLNCNETLARMVNLEMDVEGLEIAVGDVVNLQHTAMGIGVGGRIVNYEENLLDNPSFDEVAFPGTAWDPWDNNPSICRSRVVTGQVTTTDMLGNPYTLPGGGQTYSGAASWFHHSSNVNFGLSQTVTASPSTTYTISAYCWIPDLLGSDSLRIMSHNNQAETSYVQTLADFTKLNQWQRITLTLTTAADQDHITIWMGAVGRCYWDAVMVEEAAAASAWNYASRVNLDREVTLLAATVYGMTIRNMTGLPAITYGIETHTDTLDTGAVTGVRFLTRWANDPEPYSPYAFGVSPTYMKLFRVIEADRSRDMKRRLTLLEYDADVYADADPVDPAYKAAPDIGVDPTTGAYKPPPATFNKAVNLTLSEFTSRRPTGEYQSNIVVSWTPEDMVAWGQWEVVFRDVTAGDPNWIGVWAAGSYDAYDKVTKDGKAYISLVDGNTGTPFSL